MAPRRTLEQDHKLHKTMTSNDEQRNEIHL